MKTIKKKSKKNKYYLKQLDLQKKACQKKRIIRKIFMVKMEMKKKLKKIPIIKFQFFIKL